MITGEEFIKPGVPAGSKIMITSVSFDNLSGSPSLVKISNVTTNSDCASGSLANAVYVGLVAPNTTLVASFPTPIVAGRCAYADFIASGGVVTGYVLP